MPERCSGAPMPRFIKPSAAAAISSSRPDRAGPML
jgi:hypothetical protein